jgi:hypothetical protein
LKPKSQSVGIATLSAEASTSQDLAVADDDLFERHCQTNANQSLNGQ